LTFHNWGRVSGAQRNRGMHLVDEVARVECTVTLVAVDLDKALEDGGVAADALAADTLDGEAGGSSASGRARCCHAHVAGISGEGGGRWAVVEDDEVCLRAGRTLVTM
jgi:hypothetical protein